MTHPVTPADREAFLRLNNQPPEWAAKIRAGDFDDCSTLQLLAGHRIEGERAMNAETIARINNVLEVLHALRSMLKHQEGAA